MMKMKMLLICLGTFFLNNSNKLKETNMNINTNVKVCARFKLVAHKGDSSKPTKETDWFNNIVLDSGLDRMSVGTWVNSCTVASDINEPVATQTGFNSPIGRTTERQGSVTGGHNTTDPSKPYIWNRVTWRFNEGVAAGNISSVGMGWGVNLMWNIARLKDSGGNNITITVLPDELLDVQCEVRFYPQLSFSGSFDLLDKYDNLISTHNYEGTYFYGFFGSDSSWANSSVGFMAVNQSSTTARNLILDTVPNLGNNNTTSGGYSSASHNTTSYPTVRSVKGGIYANLDVANGQHYGYQIGVGLLLRQSYASWGYKWKVDLPITKTNTQRLYHYLTVSWDRYVEE